MGFLLVNYLDNVGDGQDVGYRFWLAGVDNVTLNNDSINAPTYVARGAYSA
jgi:hypothetical protein